MRPENQEGPPKFENIGGAADSNPSGLKRWVTSMIMRRHSDLTRRDRLREKTERKRKGNRLAHEIHYFHELNDGYSLLAIQILERLQTEYDVVLNCHIAETEISSNIPEPALLQKLSLTDGKLIASHYGLFFPNTDEPSTNETLNLAKRVAIPLAEENAFIELASLTLASISNDVEKIHEIGKRHVKASDEETTNTILQSNSLRKRLGHYSGAMFHYAGEWYWGIDRIHHLEKRLVDLGVRKNRSEHLIWPKPTISLGPLKDRKTLILKFFPSLRSPYTSIIFDKTLHLARETNIQLEISPVLPMVMRGVPATRRKGAYIISDTAREAQSMNIKWGQKVYDPIGEPVINCYSLYSWAQEKGLGGELLRQFLDSTFFKGLNANSSSVFREIVENTGLEWDEAKKRLQNRDWELYIEKKIVSRCTLRAAGAFPVTVFSTRKVKTWSQLGGKTDSG